MPSVAIHRARLGCLHVQMRRGHSGRAGDSNMTTTRMLYGAMMAVLLTACGGQGASVAAQKIGPAGGQVTAAGSALRLDIPAGALSKEIEIQIREVEPRQGEVQAFEIEPAEVQLEHA